MLRLVAPGALELRMRLLQCPARSPVIELLLAAFGPLDQGEVGSRMIRVTGGALGRLRPSGAMNSPASRLKPADVAVAGDTPRLHRDPAACMALGAMERPFERAMRLRQRPRGNLSRATGGKEDDHRQ